MATTINPIVAGTTFKQFVAGGAADQLIVECGPKNDFDIAYGVGSAKAIGCGSGCKIDDDPSGGAPVADNVASSDRICAAVDHIVAGAAAHGIRAVSTGDAIAAVA